MARKKTTQKQKQKQSQKVIVNVGGRGKGGVKAVHHHHHHHSINQVLTDASSTHAVNNASNTLLGHIANMTKSFESRDAEREANAVRLSYGVNPTPAFIRGFNRPAQPPAGSSGAERDAIARADAPNDNVPVARRLVDVILAEKPSGDLSKYRVKASHDPISPAPVQVAVSKRLIEDEQDLALNGLSLQNPTNMTSTVPFRQTIPNTEEFIQTNPMMANTALRQNTGDGALTIEISKSGKTTRSEYAGFELPYVVVNGVEMSGLSMGNKFTQEQIGAANPEVLKHLIRYRQETRAEFTRKQQALLDQQQKEKKEQAPKLVRSKSTDASKLRPATNESQATVGEQVALINKSKKLKLVKQSGGNVAQNKQAGGGGAMRENKGDGGGFG